MAVIYSGLRLCYLPRSDLACGDQLYDRGLQRLEAMLYAVDRWDTDLESGTNYDASYVASTSNIEQYCSYIHINNNAVK